MDHARRAALRARMEEEIERFRGWAGARAGRHGEWELDYADWDAFYGAVSRFVVESDAGDWDDPTIALLLYAIARDDEGETLADLVEEHPSKLTLLARAVVRSGESHAKWQLGDRCARCLSRDEAEPVLIELAADSDPYVQRRARLALERVRARSSAT